MLQYTAEISRQDVHIIRGQETMLVKNRLSENTGAVDVPLYPMLPIHQWLIGIHFGLKRDSIVRGGGRRTKRSQEQQGYCNANSYVCFVW